MEYNDILQRYFEAQTTAAEERALAQMLAQKQELTDEERAAKAMLSYAEQVEQTPVRVQLHQRTTRARSWQMAMAAVCVVAIAVGAWFMRPKPYCYVNGRPIYSIDEARRYAEGMFYDLAMADIKQVNSLEELFTLE